MTAEELREQASKLSTLLVHPGWQVVLDLMERRMDGAEFDMLRSDSTDPVAIIALQRRARAYRELFDGVQSDIAEVIAAAAQAAREGEANG